MWTLDARSNSSIAGKPQNQQQLKDAIATKLKIIGVLTHICLIYQDKYGIQW